MRILIADDHDLFREGLVLVLGQLEDDLEIVEAKNFDDAIAALKADATFSLVLLDLAMPGMNWADGLNAVCDTAKDVPVIVLSASEDHALVMQAVKMGAAGFIPKSSNSKVMLSALKLVLSGGVYLPPALLSPDQGGGKGAPPMASVNKAGGIAPSDEAIKAILTPRQREVLSLMGEGKSNKEIARFLDLSEGTVKLHVTAILKALKVNNRTRAVVMASQMTGGGVSSGPSGS